MTYLNGRGNGEVTRLILAYAGVNYEDVRIERKDIPALKSKFPNGQVPVFEIDGKTYCQSNAISRYLAKQYGLGGKTALDNLRIDMVVDTLEEMLNALRAWFFEQNPEKKVEVKKKCEEEQLPTFLQNLEKILIANKGGDGYFVGNGLTWADLMLFNWLKFPISAWVGANADYSKVPKLLALYDRVQNEPKLTAWLEKRPDTPF